jgi:hypothetical protein
MFQLQIAAILRELQTLRYTQRAIKFANLKMVKYIWLSFNNVQCFFKACEIIKIK